MSVLFNVSESYSSDYDPYMMGMGDLIRKPDELLWDIQDFRPGKKASADGPDFKFDTYHMDRNQVEKMMRNIVDPVLVAGEAVAEPGVIYLFDSQDSFDAWAIHTRFAKDFQKIASIIHDAHKEAGNASNKKANKHTSPRLAGGKSSDSAMTLFEDANFSGKTFSSGPCIINDLNDIHFSQCVKSIKVHGTCLLTDQPFFGGLKFYLTGDPTIEVADLARWGFNNSAMSAVIL